MCVCSCLLKHWGLSSCGVVSAEDGLVWSNLGSQYEGHGIQTQRGPEVQHFVCLCQNQTKIELNQTNTKSNNPQNKLQTTKHLRCVRRISKHFNLQSSNLLYCLLKKYKKLVNNQHHYLQIAAPPTFISRRPPCRCSPLPRSASRLLALAATASLSLLWPRLSACDQVLSVWPFPIRLSQGEPCHHQAFWPPTPLPQLLDWERCGRTACHSPVRFMFSPCVLTRRSSGGGGVSPLIMYMQCMCTCTLTFPQPAFFPFFSLNFLLLVVISGNKQCQRVLLLCLVLEQQTLINSDCSVDPSWLWGHCSSALCPRWGISALVIVR